MQTIPERFDECRGFDQRRAWLAEENWKRCEAANARKAEKPVEHVEWTLDPPAR